MTRLIAFLAALLLPLSAFAQGAIQQVGPATRYDPLGFIQDHQAEAASKMFTDNGRGLNPAHIYDQAGTGTCWDDALSSGPYHEICITHDSSGNAVISTTANNGASPAGLKFINNGTPVVPPTSGGTPGVSITAYGADITGTSDSTAALNNCLAAVANTGLGCLTYGAKLKILGNVTIPAHSAIDCGVADLDAEDGPAVYGTLPAIMLDGAHTISAGGIGATIRNCLVYRNGMTFPAADSTAYTGLAFSDAGFGNAFLYNDVFIGFDRAVLVSGTRPYLDKVYADCAGVTNGCIDVENGNTDSGYFEHIKLQPLGTGNYPGGIASGCVAATRAGSGFFMNGINYIGDITVTNFRISEVRLVNYTLANKIWTDFSYACVAGGTGGTSYTPVGLFIGSVGATIRQLNVNGLTTGLSIFQAAPNQSVSISDMFCNTLSQDCIDLGSGSNTGGYVHIGNLSINLGGAPLRYAVNYADTSNTTTFQLDGGTLYGANGGIAPYINLPNVPANKIKIGDTIQTDLANPATLYGATTVANCTGLGTTGTCNIVASGRTNPYRFQVNLAPNGTGIAALGSFDITWPLVKTHDDACNLTYKSGSTNWASLLPAQIGSISTTKDRISWSTGAALTAGQTYTMNVDCELE